MVLRFYHYPIPALPPNAPMTPAALAPTPAPPETCVRADRKACRKGAVGGPVLGPLARTRAIFTDRHLLRGIPRVCIGIMRVRRATHGGGIMKPVVIYRAPDEKRAIFFERFAATPFYGSDVSGEEARKYINANPKQGAGGSCRTSTYILDRMAAETITYARLLIAVEQTCAPPCAAL